MSVLPRLRPLGLLGGMSWESTAEYYRLLNRGVAARLGGLHSAPLLLHSVDFAGVAALQQAGDWAGAGAQLADAARGLEGAGATALLLCTNTMHHVADTIEAAVSIPLLHIVDPTGAALRGAGIRRAGLLGTRFTMELPFWQARLHRRHDVEVLVPEPDDRALVHRVIYEELCRGVVSPAARAAYREVMTRLAERGAEGIILGCTEIALLVNEADTPLPLFDTTALHAAAGVEYLLAATAPEA